VYQSEKMFLNVMYMCMFGSTVRLAWHNHGNSLRFRQNLHFEVSTKSQCYRDFAKLAVNPNMHIMNKAKHQSNESILSIADHKKRVICSNSTTYCAIL